MAEGTLPTPSSIFSADFDHFILKLLNTGIISVYFLYLFGGITLFIGVLGRVDCSGHPIIGKTRGGMIGNRRATRYVSVQNTVLH